jgi:HSP20 family molecular chaperone IbpA
MSLFHRSALSPFVPEPSFTPLFRLLDDFDTYSGAGRRGNTNALKSFQPKFDVKEVENAYELHGELPGIDQKDVEIEFVDQQTINIRGRTERHYERGTRPTGHIESPTATGAITEGETASHKATIEDDPAEPATPPAENSQVVKQQEEPKEPASKYWVSERSVGEFSRTFSFPARVDQDQVKASMKDGILSIVVPKAKKHESRKIAIN